MSPTVTDSIIEDPIREIKRVFDEYVHDKEPSSTVDYGVWSLFRDAFPEAKQRRRLPLLNAVKANDNMTGKLVRYRCYVSDTDYGHEMFVGASRTNGTEVRILNC